MLKHHHGSLSKTNNIRQIIASFTHHSSHARTNFQLKPMKKSITAIVATATLISASLLASGCSSIVHNGQRNVFINSKPEGAQVTVTTAEGRAVTIQKTPCSILLAPKKGYFSGQSYKLKFDLAGYRTAELNLRPSLSGWYWGNLLFGGLIGMLIVDPLTGAMWNISPDKIDYPLSPEQHAITKNGEGIVVVLIADLTESERLNMVRIN